MQKIGVIEKISEDTINTKFGPKTKANFVIEGMIYSKWGKSEDNSKDKKPLKVGDKVLIDYDVNNEYNNIKTIVLVLPDLKEDKTPQTKLPIEQVSETVEKAILKEICAKLATMDERIALISERLNMLEKGKLKEHISNDDLQYLR